MEITKNDNCFKFFIDYYKKNKIKFIWNRNSLRVVSEDLEFYGEVTKEEFGAFVSNFSQALRDQVLLNKGNEEYGEYINKLFQEDKDLKSDIIMRSMGNNNICDFIGLEILTKRNYNLDIQGFSALINLNLQKPNVNQDLATQINFELSSKDLKRFRKILDKAIKDIDKLNSEQ